MSARSASTRAELFKEVGSLSERENSRYEEQKNYEDEQNPLQLEHMLGYGGDLRKPLLASPSNENIYYKSIGSLVAIENLTDPHCQVFLRGHDMPICALAISDSGNYVASGQLGTSNYKGNAAPIFLWNSKTCQRLAVLRGLSGRVTILAFSPDDMLLCACDEDSLFYVWDLSAGEVCYGQKIAKPISILKWADQKKVNHHISYELVLGIGSVVSQGLFTFDAFREQWSMKWTPYQVPPNGNLIRSYNCVDLSRDRIFVYVGTSSGEMMVYRRDTLVFRACIPICTNGLNDLVSLADDSILCGGGDGLFVKLVGKDMTWQVIKQVKLENMIKSISLSCNGAEVLLACASGTVMRCLTDNLICSSISICHTSGISCICFPSNFQSAAKESSISFATGTMSGEIKVWDLLDYTCLSAIRFPKSGTVKCLALPDRNSILSGWEDGSIRCTTAAGQLVWFIPTAHRDGTTTIASHVDPSLQYFVTGGGDGAVRVWKYSNRELVTQYTEHRKGVSKVIIDIKSPNIVHSVGGDCSVLSFDLKASRRIICHMINSGAMIDMTQRKDDDLELITSDSLGRLLYWDIDIRDPVIAVQDPSRTAIRCCKISPSGRFLAFAGDDQLLKVLEEKSHQIISIGQAHSSPIITLTWTPDEKQILSGGADSSLCIWNFYLGSV